MKKTINILAVIIQVLRLQDTDAQWACLVFLEQRIAVKQLALHIDTWVHFKRSG